MKRSTIAAIYAALIVMLLAIPTRAGSPCYPTNYQQGYVYPAGYYPQTYSQTIYSQQYEVSPYYPTFRVAQDLVTARLIEEAVNAAHAKDKAEYARQQESARQAAIEQQNAAFQQQMLAAIQQLQQQRLPATIPTVADPEVARLRAENEQMKAALQQIIQAQKGPQPQALPEPPKASAQPIPNQPKNPVLDNVKLAVANNCMPCHGAGKSPRMDLSDPTKLTAKDVALCMALMGDPDDKKRMPKDKPPVTGEVYFAFSQLLVQLAGK